MKRRLIGILLSVGFVLCGAGLFAGCGGLFSGLGQPKTVQDYVNKAVEQLPSVYSASVRVQHNVAYKTWDGRDSSAYVVVQKMRTVISKSKGKVETSVVVTDYEDVYKSEYAYIFNEDNIIGEETGKSYFEFLQGAEYKVNEYSVRKRTVISSESPTKEGFDKKLLDFHNAEFLITAVTSMTYSGVDEYTNQHCQENPRAKYRIYGNDGGVANGKVSGNVSCYLAGNYDLLEISHSYADSEGESYRIRIILDGDTDELFDKSAFYATEEESVKAVMDGVLNNLPTRYRVATQVKVIANGQTMTSDREYMAYEKRGDVEYYYLSDSADSGYYLVESYQKSGNGHIGTTYNRSNKTYYTKICETEMCASADDADTNHGHTYRVSAGHSFVTFAVMRNSASAFEVDFNDEGICTLTLNSESEGVNFKYTYTIDGDQLKSVVISMFYADSDDGMVELFKFSYDGDEVTYDVSDYVQED